MSIYTKIELFESSASSLIVSPPTLTNFIESIINLLIEEEIETTLWIKPATTWTEEIRKYQNQGKVKKIYWCQTSECENPNPSSIYNSPVIPVQLKHSPDLAKEFFLIAISKEFSILLLVKQPPVSTIPTKLTRRNSSLQLKLFCTSEYSIINEILKSIKEEMISEEWRDRYLQDEISTASATSIESVLFVKLLLKQIKQTEKLTQSTINPTNSNQALNLKNHQSLLLQEEFITQLTSELRPPLTNMRTAISLLESKTLKTNQRQRYLDLLHREWEKQNSLLTGLLELVKLDHLSSQESSPQADVTEILPSIISTYQPIAAERNIQLEYKMPSNLPLVYCPNLWLKKIIFNLLDNNLKYTEKGGRVYVEASLTPNGVVIAFTDTGKGIMKEELPKIFKSFYRGNNQEAEENTGAGLGLTVVQQLLNRCHGSITVKSKINQGSTFQILLQIVDS